MNNAVPDAIIDGMPIEDYGPTNRILIEYPVNERVITTQREFDAGQIDVAVKSTHPAFKDGHWRRALVRERQQLQRAISDRIDSSAELLSEGETENTGMLLSGA